MGSLPDGETTVLNLSFGVPPFSARGLNQTLEPIQAATSLRRTVNGVLKDLSDTAFQKYRSVISGNDQQSPAFDDIWPGRVVTVECITELAFEGTGSTSRTPVTGSEREESGFTFYRPVLTMMVVDLQINTDEYGALVGWSLSLEEE